ncbi:hypothetical protein [Polaromonas naphthalenivorans]|uniref:hypothetical protein n=1 Tax=Polaromonas naphthalenivorans TaxID=216465 RepID=UPI000310C21B|nr:hypothetical protein [Polaromonas naphthalenivorans]
MLTLTSGSKGLGGKIFYNFIEIGTRQALPKIPEMLLHSNQPHKKADFHALQQGINAPA